MDEMGPRQLRKGNGAETGSRMLSLLDLYTVEEPRWTVEMIMERMQLPQATVYRYVRMLVDAGLLSGSSSGGFRLGSRFLEFDRQIRLSDPLIQIGPQIMAEQRSEVQGTQYLCTYYGNKVLTVHQDGPDDNIIVSLERGKTWPLFRGSPAHVILANLPTTKLKNIYLNHADDIAAAELGENWPDFLAKMKQVKKAGYAVGIGVISSGVSGVSAPVFGPGDAMMGCICLVRPQPHLTDGEVEVLSKLATTSAARITAALVANGGSL